MPNLAREQWPKLSQYQMWALEILADKGAQICPECPLSMKTAMHDMWRFGFAKRDFSPLRYLITDLGLEAAAVIITPKPKEEL